MTITPTQAPIIMTFDVNDDMTVRRHKPFLRFSEFIIDERTDNEFAWARILLNMFDRHINLVV